MMFFACVSVIALSLTVDQDILAKKAILSPTQLRAMSSDKAPVTKAELVAVLTKLVGYLESTNKQKRSFTLSTVQSKTARDLVKAGYLPSDSSLLNNPSSAVTRGDLSAALAQILIRHNEKSVPITPDSRRATPIPHPSENSGS